MAEELEKQEQTGQAEAGTQAQETPQGLTQDAIDADREEFYAAFEEFSKEDEEQQGSPSDDLDLTDDDRQADDTKQAPAAKRESQGADATPKDAAKSETTDQKQEAASKSDTEGTEATPTQEQINTWKGRASASDRRANEFQRENNALKQRVVELEAGRQAAEQAAGASKEEQQKSAEKAYQEFAEVYGEEHAKDIMKLVKTVLATEAKPLIDQSIKPIRDNQEQQIQSQQADKIARAKEFVISKHSDASEYKADLPKGQDLIAWIEEQPVYARPGLMDIYNGRGSLGTPENIVKLLDDYKQARGLTQSADDTATQAKGKASQEAQRQAAADAAAAVPSRKRGALPASRPDANAPISDWFDFLDKQEAAGRR